MPAYPHNIRQHIHERATDTYSGQPVTTKHCLSACEWAACDLLAIWKGSRAQKKCKAQQNMENESVSWLFMSAFLIHTEISVSWTCLNSVHFLSYKIMTYNKLWSCLDISVWLWYNFLTSPRGGFKNVQSSKDHKNKETFNVHSSNYKQKIYF